MNKPTKREKPVEYEHMTLEAATELAARIRAYWLGTYGIRVSAWAERIEGRALDHRGEMYAVRSDIAAKLAK